MEIKQTDYNVEIIMSHSESRKLAVELCMEEWSFPVLGPLKDEEKAITHLLHCLLTGEELKNEN